MNKGKIQKGKLVRTSEDVRECSGDIRKLVRMVTSAYRRCGGTYRGETSELEVRRSEDVRKLDRIGKCSGDIRKLVRTGCPLTIVTYFILFYFISFHFISFYFILFHFILFYLILNCLFNFISFLSLCVTHIILFYFYVFYFIFSLRVNS